MFNINTLVQPRIVDELFECYYRGENGVRELSSHWRHYASLIKCDLDRSGRMRLSAGSGLGCTQQGSAADRLVSAICRLSYMNRVKERDDVRYLSKKAAANIRKIGSYLSYDFFRQIVSFVCIRRHLDRTPDGLRGDVLMIGDGYGFLSALIKSVYPQARIALVDIGKILIFQAVNIQTIFPFCRHALISDGGAGPGSHDNADFVYCPADRLDLLRGMRYRLIINISSMQEMEMKVINRYFDIMRSSTGEGYFYSCNRVERELWKGIYIRTIDYPWHKKDDIVVDELCPWYQKLPSSRPPFSKLPKGPYHHRLVKLYRAKAEVNF